ncbi:Uncharacterised protein [Mycoplasmopsis glycophila]|uniref:Uncharacterized protein n=1 Tax=Mycoplasmopsis glycophila TaxID=171285 RepID=A0A449AUJ8_9BACT|nr:Uncharacterised protein [Mycoplasmopsis glycophila]
MFFCFFAPFETMKIYMKKIEIDKKEGENVKIYLTILNVRYN